MSFWKMKDRAAKFGESGGFQLLHNLQTASGNDVRFHLMGHSFGCVVMSATLAGPRANNALVRPVDSVALLQGAVVVVLRGRYPVRCRPAGLLSSHHFGGPRGWSAHHHAVGT